MSMETEVDRGDQHSDPAQDQGTVIAQVRKDRGGRIHYASQHPTQSGSHLQEDGVGHGGVGVDDDGSCLVVPDLLEERSGVPRVIQHPD